MIYNKRRCKKNSTPKPEQPSYGSSGLLILQKRRMNRKKRMTNKQAGKCHAQNVTNIESGSRPESHFFQMELMKIKTAGNHAELKKKRLEAEYRTV